MGRESDSDSRVRLAPSSVVAYATLMLGIALISAAHWPGRLNADSNGIIGGVEGRLPIVDHWAATITWAWRQGYELFGLGTAGILLMQTTGIVVGAYLILRACFSRLTAAVLAVLVPLAPPTVGFVGLIGRDLWFVAGCLLGVGLAVGAVRWRRRTVRCAAIAAGALATVAAVATRQNGFSAAFAIFVGLAAPALMLLREHGLAPSLTRRALLGAGTIGLAATLLAMAAVGTSDRLTRERALHPEVVTYLYDIGYLTLREDRRIIPPMSYTAVLAQTPDEVRERWLPTTALFMRADPASKRTRYLLTDAEVDTIGDTWRAAVTNSPLWYLNGRFALWRRQVGIGHTPAYTRAPEVDSTVQLAQHPALPRLAAAATDYAQIWGSGDDDDTRGGVVHHAWVYLLACLLGLALVLPRFPATVRVVASLPAAAIGLQAGLFITAPSVQWRFQLLVAYAGVIVLMVMAKAGYDLRRRDANGYTATP
jgi:hypothetical protein